MLNIKKSQISVTWIFAILLLCDPDGIQTHDLQNRNLTLYSAKLQGQRKFRGCSLNGLKSQLHPHNRVQNYKKKTKENHH